jgi:hypothetical protein
MWEKMVGKRQGIILEYNGILPHEMVKGVVTCVKANPVKNCPVQTKKHKKCGIESCNAFVHGICKSKKFASNMPIQSTRKGVSSVLKIMLKLVEVSAEVVLEANRKRRRH